MALRWESEGSVPTIMIIDDEPFEMTALQEALGERRFNYLFATSGRVEVVIESAADAHGRGVMMANGTLDIEYIAPGNQVLASVPLVDPD
jgi:hypothetical protein